MSEPRSGSRPGAESEAPVPEFHPESGPTPAAEPVSTPAESTSGPSYGPPPGPGTPPAYGTPSGPGTPPAYGNPPAYGPPTFGPIGGSTAEAGPGVGAMAPSEERNWAVAAHLSGFVAAYVALGFLGPLVVMLSGGNRSPFVRRHAVEALNFNLSVLLYLVVSAVLVLVLVGIPMLIAIGLLYLVTTIQGALAASRGQEFRYPLTIRFIS